MMQVVRIIEKVAMTSRNLKGTYVRALRMAALKLYAGINILAHRTQEGDRGESNEAIAGLRRKVRGLQLDRERMERELEHPTPGERPTKQQGRMRT